MYLLCISSTFEEPLKVVEKPTCTVGLESCSFAPEPWQLLQTLPQKGCSETSPRERDFRAERPNCFKVPGFIHLEITQLYFSLPNIAVVTVCMGQLLCISHKQGRAAPRRFAVRLTVWNLAFQQIAACTVGLEDLLNLTENTAFFLHLLP